MPFASPARHAHRPPGARGAGRASVMVGRYWSAGEPTCRKPGGMVTVALAALAAVGFSHRTLVTDESFLGAAGPANVLDQLVIRTGRYVARGPPQGPSDPRHFSRTALAAPQASVALMKADQWSPGAIGPPISILAVFEHALVGWDVVIGERLYSRL
jgi:hypothetical protein